MLIILPHSELPHVPGLDPQIPTDHGDNPKRNSEIIQSLEEGVNEDKCLRLVFYLLWKGRLNIENKNSSLPNDGKTMNLMQYEYSHLIIEVITFQSMLPWSLMYVNMFIECIENFRTYCSEN